MEAKELRIGNLLAASDGIVCKVVEIREDGYKTKPIIPIRTHPVFQTGDAIKPRLPIPLTEEWLKKFGFEKDWLWEHEKEYFPMFEIKGGYIFTSDHHHHTGIKIQYVHQLQNIFFALTGEELTIEE